MITMVKRFAKTRGRFKTLARGHNWSTRTRGSKRQKGKKFQLRTVSTQKLKTNLPKPILAKAKQLSKIKRKILSQLNIPTAREEGEYYRKYGKSIPILRKKDLDKRYHVKIYTKGFKRLVDILFTNDKREAYGSLVKAKSSGFSVRFYDTTHERRKR